MSEQIRAVLFDCDGVLQRPTNDWGSDIARLTGLGERELPRFYDDVAAADRAALDGRTTLVAGVEPVLRRWGLSVDPADLVATFQQVVVDPAMLEAVVDLREAGVVCALGTNQHPERAAYMRASLGYHAWFDPMLISAEVGAAKPEAAFFEAAVAAIGLPAGQVLFVDDVPANVAGARGVGLVAEVFAKDAGRPELDRILALHGLADLAAA